MGIIGIVAAFTIPVLVQNIQQRILISRWKKAYAEINEAFELVKSQDDIETYYNCKDLYCFQDVANLIIQKYIIKPKQTNTATTAANASYKTILGDNFIYFPTFHQAYNVKDMTFFTWSYFGSSCTIFVDVNGSQNKPNVLGKDLFALVIKNDKMSPFGQNSVGDFCKGVGQEVESGFQSITYDENNNVQGIPNSNYAGLGCSYTYLYK